MNNIQMFCRQCQETFGNIACTRGGVCGKRPAASAAMDRLIARLEDLAAARPPTRDLGRFVTESLFLTLTNVNFDGCRLAEAVAEAERRLRTVSPRNRPQAFSDPSADIRSLKELTLFGLKGVSAYLVHAAALGREDDRLYGAVLRTLRTLARTRSIPALVRLALGCGRTAAAAMALLDDANTGTYGEPSPAEVDLGVGKRPGILVSGHDLRDLWELLDQSADAGVDVYTHGEMLPTHAYPAFRKYPHLRGNYGDAWHRQQADFTAFNGAILMTSNCIVPVLPAYSGRIFTTGPAGHPGVPHIGDRRDGEPKDFSAVIACARRCRPPTGLEHGRVVCGYAREQLQELVGPIVAAVRSGAIRKFVVMAGCDGRHQTRDYYREVAERLPKDAVILTAGCAKYRYIKLGLGDIGGIPRVLDAGQCNDIHSIVAFARALKAALGVRRTGDLPIAFDIAWYEQKAVAALLALLALGFRGIRLGPTLPAFLSAGVRRVLQERFGIRPIGLPEEDVRHLAGA